MGAKVSTLCFRHICFVSRISRQKSYRVSLREHPVFSAQVSSFTVSSALSQLVNRAEISHLNPRGNWTRCGMPLWKWTCELVTDLFQELFHFLGWSRILNRLQFYFGCLMLRFSSGHMKTKIGGTDNYQIFLYMIPHPHPILRGFPRKICI